MGKPQAADVPTDCFIGNPAQFKNGTVKLQPPIPKIEDAKQIPVPAPNFTPADGNVLPNCPYWDKNNILKATNSARTPMMACKTFPSIISAIPAPTKLPMTKPNAILRHTSQRTPPRLLWAVKELIEVTTIVASEVPIAKWVTTSGEKR